MRRSRSSVAFGGTIFRVLKNSFHGLAEVHKVESWIRAASVASLVVALVVVKSRLRRPEFEEPNERKLVMLKVLALVVGVESPPRPSIVIDGAFPFVSMARSLI